MSAWLCSQTHIAAIATVLADQGRDPVAAGETLLRQNERSLRARYDDAEAFFNEGGDLTAPYVHREVRVDDVTLVKVTRCFDYQACETDDYGQTEAAELSRLARDAALARLGLSEPAVRELPAYVAAPWGID